ncbi:cytoplasmic FMR1-interacting protein 2-like isoform X1 [Bolinopsis microptera]|uniref:cytoplasmic FMR1-interacting protein 2-like isoform X1 n=1 Tax=Bolinopsis microptera TaxID=2820187 RepID=UPI00307947BA
MFVGQPHFAAIIDLLGYQGVSLIIEGLLENVRNKLTYSLLNYVLTLKEGMPPELNRPRFEYGPIGVFEFYHTKLESIFRYSELTTNVFQTIREIGNFVLFTMLIEQVMSEEEIMDLLQASPFLGIMPKPVVKNEENEETREKKVMEKTKMMEAHYSSLVLISQIEKTGTPEQVDIARDSLQLARERLCKNLSILSYVLEKLRSYLSNEGWIGDNPPNGVMYMDECKEFHRLWSAMQLFIAMSPLMSGAGSQNSNESSNKGRRVSAPNKAGKLTKDKIQFSPGMEVENCPPLMFKTEMFGEGLHWAALTIITILGQQHRFDSLDFSYHLLRVFDEKPKDGISCGISIKKLVDRIRHIQLMNNRIFGVLNKYSSSDGSVSSTIPMQEVKYFPPPIRNIQ